MRKEIISKLTQDDLSILKYYNEGNELCGFESNSPWNNLVRYRLLNDDLELTSLGYDVISEIEFSSTPNFNNKTKTSVKPIL